MFDSSSVQEKSPGIGPKTEDSVRLRDGNGVVDLNREFIAA